MPRARVIRRTGFQPVPVFHPAANGRHGLQTRATERRAADETECNPMQRLGGEKPKLTPPDGARVGLGCRDFAACRGAGTVSSPPMPEFMPGLRLSELFFRDAVRPIVVRHFASLVYS